MSVPDSATILAMFLETAITAFILLILCALVCVRQDADLTSVSDQPPAPMDHSELGPGNQSSASASLTLPTPLMSDASSISPSISSTEVADSSLSGLSISLTPDFQRFAHADSDNTLGGFCLSDDSFYKIQSPSPVLHLPEFDNFEDESFSDSFEEF